jgi:soluble lytic murein transglycosylase-like protein
MPRARSISQDQRQTAAASENGSGCLSFYWIPPLAALFIACLLAIFALKAPLQTSALHNSVNNQISAAPISTATPQSNTLPLPVITQELPVADNSMLVVPTSEMIVNVVDQPQQRSNNPLFDFAIAPAPNTTGISPILSQEIQYWANDIVRWATESSLDPNLVAVIMQIESCGDPRAISRSGAIGLFQVMPFHFHITDNPFNPDTNARRGLNYLSRSLEAAGGNARLALAGYNGGIGVISRGEWTWSAETQRYVEIGAPLYEEARSGATYSPTMDKWYARGTSLCRQARNRLGITE